MADVNLPIRLSVRDDGSATLEQVSKKLKSVGVSAKAMEKDMAEANRRLRTLADGFKGLLGAAGLGFGAAEVVGFFRSAITEARDAERATLKLNAVLRATGNASGFSAEALSDYASELQALTGVENDVIVDAEAMLATFRSISGDVFRQATASALDLSAVMGQDLKASVIQIGKALQDPVAGLTALRRVGVSFSEEQQKQIKQWVQHGDLLSAQKAILKELQTEFGGAAAAMQGPMSRALADVTLAWKDLQEAVGNNLADSPEVQTWAHGLADLIRSLSVPTSVIEGWRTFREELDSIQVLYLRLKGDLFKDSSAHSLADLIQSETESRIRARVGSRESGIPIHYGSRPFEMARATKPPPGGGGGGEPKAPKYGDVPSVLSLRYADEARSDAAFSAWEARSGQAEIAVGTGLAEQARRDFAAWEKVQKEQAARLEANRRALADGNAATAARAREIDREAFASWEEAQKEKATRDEEYRQRGLDRVAETNARALELERAHHESLMGLIHARAEAERQTVRERNAALTAGVSLMGQVLGDTAALMRQLYEDSGGQAKKYWEYYKAMAIGEATIATAQGVLNVWAGPLGKYPPAAAAFSAAVGALGAAKIALIAQQQPAKSFAEGGIVARPLNALIGEAGPEAVIPLRRMPELLPGASRSPAGAVQITVNVPVQGGLDAATAGAVRAEIVRVTEATVLATLQGDPRARRAMLRAVRRG